MRASDVSGKHLACMNSDAVFEWRHPLNEPLFVEPFQLSPHFKCRSDRHFGMILDVCRCAEGRLDLVADVREYKPSELNERRD